jgi:hypothetical protein|tara:strand:+ start:60332 stop:61447 length:1116 start_codon:yes stop_codon:yes gene_type:complete
MVWFFKGKARSSAKKKKRIEPSLSVEEQHGESAPAAGSFSAFDDAVLARAAQDAMEEVSDGLAPERKQERFFAEKIAGEEPVISALTSYVPPNLVGGVIPHIGGMEDDVVIKAATQGCGTSNVFYKYSVHEGRLWYIAAPASDLASFPDTWCPMVLALPGQAAHWDIYHAYVFEKENKSTLLYFEEGGTDIIIQHGEPRFINSRAQVIDPNYRTLHTYSGETPRWYHANLREETLRRGTLRILFGFGVLLNLLLVIYIGTGAFVTGSISSEIKQAKLNTKDAITQLETLSRDVRSSKIHPMLSDLGMLLDEMETAEGTLVLYELQTDGRIKWDALVPSTYLENPNARKAQKLSTVDKYGRVRIRGYLSWGE